jgi:hypothetical protein
MIWLCDDPFDDLEDVLWGITHSFPPPFCLLPCLATLPPINHASILVYLFPCNHWMLET